MRGSNRQGIGWSRPTPRIPRSSMGSRFRSLEARADGSLMIKRAVAFVAVVLLASQFSPARTEPVVIPTVGGDSCSVRIREAGFRDSLIRERNPLLGAPEHPNDAPGPGPLRAEVRSDSLHHPFIHIVDKAKGTS